MFNSKEEIAAALNEFIREPAAEPERQRDSGQPATLMQRIANLVWKPGHKDDPVISQEAADRILTLLKPAIWLEPHEIADEDDIPIGTTKIAGRPDLPDGMDWPHRPPHPKAQKTHKEMFDGSKPTTRENIIAMPYPLHFIAQIDFAEMHNTSALEPGFPATGRLFIFYDGVAQPWGFDPDDHTGLRLIYSEADTDQLVRKDAPQELLDIKDFGPYPPIACRAHPGFSPPNPDLPAVEQLGLSESDAEAYFDIYHATLAETDQVDRDDNHRIGGWPAQIQGDMQTECALVAAGHYCGDATAYQDPALADIRATATDWMLLAQVDSSTDSHMMWGDSGRLYIWIRQDDLTARRFDEARLVLQCY